MVSVWSGDALSKRYRGISPADHFSSHSHLTFLSFSSNRVLRIVLAVRRDSSPHLSLPSRLLHHRPPRTAWPWITGAACMLQGPSRVPWKPAEQRIAQPTPLTASVPKWVPASFLCGQPTPRLCLERALSEWDTRYRLKWGYYKSTLLIVTTIQVFLFNWAVTFSHVVLFVCVTIVPPNTKIIPPVITDSVATSLSQKHTLRECVKAAFFCLSSSLCKNYQTVFYETVERWSAGKERTH